MYMRYYMSQQHLPSDLETEISAYHVVRGVNDAVNRIQDAIFDAGYPGGGRDPDHPKMLTKVVIYAYTQRIYSSRQIAEAVRENVPILWVAARQSFSKIDRDATFMWKKEDLMRHGRLEPGYNLQIGTEDQFIVGYSRHQQPTDTCCLIPHLVQVRAQTGELSPPRGRERLNLPERAAADLSARECQENREWLYDAGTVVPQPGLRRVPLQSAVYQPRRQSGNPGEHSRPPL